jgi:hypothetical protein
MESERSVLVKLLVLYRVYKLAVFCGKRMFTTVVTEVHYMYFS